MDGRTKSSAKLSVLRACWAKAGLQAGLWRYGLVRLFSGATHESPLRTGWRARPNSTGHRLCGYSDSPDLRSPWFDAAVCVSCAVVQPPFQSHLSMLAVLKSKTQCTQCLCYRMLQTNLCLCERRERHNPHDPNHAPYPRPQSRRRIKYTRLLLCAPWRTTGSRRFRPVKVGHEVVRPAGSVDPELCAVQHSRVDHAVGVRDAAAHFQAHAGTIARFGVVEVCERGQEAVVARRGPETPAPVRLAAVREQGEVGPFGV